MNMTLSDNWKVGQISNGPYMREEHSQLTKDIQIENKQVYSSVTDFFYYWDLSPGYD